MSNYSITLNFFIPKNIVNVLKEVYISENLLFDWRESEYCHCTVKSFGLFKEIPSEEVLSDWISVSEKILDIQKPFNVSLQDISNFSDTIYAKIKSNDLITLHKNLNTKLPSIIPEHENNNYLPHVSIAILSRLTEVTIEKNQNFGNFTVNNIQLIIWNLKNLSHPNMYHSFNL